jgi:hypothetical protein
MPSAGDTEIEYGRVYKFIKPNSTDPGTWRLSLPDATGGGGSGGGGTGGVTHDIIGIKPVETATVGVNPRLTTISLDFISLAKR